METGMAVDFATALLQLAEGAGVVAAVAFLLERVPLFQAAPSKAKWWVSLGLFAAIPVLAQVVLQSVPPETLAAINVYWEPFSRGMTLWAGSQIAHKLIKR